MLFYAFSFQLKIMSRDGGWRLAYSIILEFLTEMNVDFLNMAYCVKFFFFNLNGYIRDYAVQYLENYTFSADISINILDL